MGLFLLGIPLAIMGLNEMRKDIKYTTTDLKVNNAPSTLTNQYKQIDENFIDILKYCGAKCDIKTIGYNQHKIINAQQGQYGGMERYLAEKGYSFQAIRYAKNKFDTIAKQQQKQKDKERDKRIKNFENELSFKQTTQTIIRNNICTVFLPQKMVEKEIERLIDYFNNHHNDVQCNIIMEDEVPYRNHQEVWHIQKPIGADVCQYYWDVCDKLDIKWKN